MQVLTFDSQQWNFSFSICLKSHYFKLNIPYSEKGSEIIREGSAYTLSPCVIESIKKCNQ